MSVFIVSFNYSGRIPYEYYHADVQRITSHFSARKHPVSVYTDRHYLDAAHFMEFLRVNSRAGNIWYFLGHAEPQGFLLPGDVRIPWYMLMKDIDIHGQTCIFDCCYAGTAITASSRAAIMASSRAEEKSIFINATCGSLFTYCLFTGRLGQVSSMAAKTGAQQTPIYRGSFPSSLPKSNRFSAILKRNRKVEAGTYKCNI